jgi:protein NrfC
MAETKEAGGKEKTVLRREFLVGSGAAIAAGAVLVCTNSSTVMALAQADAPAKTSYPESTGYLVYDSRLCLGCQSCMLACSLTHEGEAAFSRSRIQIIRDAPNFTKYPLDVVMSVCKQCTTPACVQNCPVHACHIDEANGNIRIIDQTKCIGCQKCITSCSQKPHRTVWNPVKKKSAKCDLCANAPYWSKPGGPSGKQACIEACTVKALKLVAAAPSQTDNASYDINLGSTGSGRMGSPGMGMGSFAAPKQQ